MGRFSAILAAGLVAGLLIAAAPAIAAEPVVTLQVEQGNVMVSTGAEFVTVESGARLVEGQRLMLTDGATARLDYGNQCAVEYAVPGVYVIERDCKNLANVDWASAGKVVAGVAVTAAVLNNIEDQPGPPVSR